LWNWQRILQFSTVEGPPFPRGTTWSISGLVVEPHTPPPSTGHWHFPPSRAQTARFTAAVTWSGFAGRGFFCGLFTSARRSTCFSSSRSSAASITCSFVAPGWTCPCPRRAASSFSRNWFDTVRWIRLSLAVRGSTLIGGTGRASGSGLLGGVSSGRKSARSRSGHTTGRTIFATWVTTSRLGTTAAGRMAAATALACRFDMWKNWGRASSLFSGVITRASSTMLVRQSLPSRSGSTTSGNRWMSLAATLRKCAAPSESRSSRCR
jgi:hypothetical protein